MEILEHIALFFHLVGFAALFGVAAVQVRAKERIARNGMMHGALTQLVSGLILAGVVIFEGEEVSHVVLTVKCLIVLTIIGILFYYREKSEQRFIPAKPFFTVFGLTFIEVIIAVWWL